MTEERPGWGAEDSLTVTWNDPGPALALVRTVSGLDYLRGIAAGELPAPPIAQLLGMRIGRVLDGEVDFTLEPHPSHYNPIGVVHGGVLSTVLDTVTGCAVHSTLPAGSGYTSIDLNVSYLRGVTLDSGTLTFTGRVIKRGRRVMFASAEGVDARGEVVATATSSLLVMHPSN
ncbi:PaaI family thioesterase [Lysinimonas soli]|uniref:PaaI family thioesterase n=1 Tax=Lysinimonas soli TaxID=1074233 RepID=A0ABW0NR40_9MICO